MMFSIKIPESSGEPKLLNFGGTNPKTGETLGVTSKYFLKDGKPWFPIMGEFHFSRYDERFWEKEILKIKAGGVTVLGTYVFWVHHEETEGEYCWDRNRDLNKFLSLCGKHDMKVILRIGPWAHGECRHGGFPDWLVNKAFELRSDNPGYLACVDKFYSETAKQATGHLYKDGGCLIGIQIENEYGHCGGFTGEKGLRHMLTLKKIALEKGFDVPFYTATGWGGAVVPEGEMLPVLGAYVDAPWDRSVSEMPASNNFVFSHLLNDENVGSDFKRESRADEEFTFNPSNYPYAMAELGGGLQVTKRRRTVVTALDTQAMVYSKFGSGSNLLGYYMYHGGTNPKGKLTTLQESTSVGNYCDLSVLNYDFQAPLGEYGEMKHSYRCLKILHMLINDFGEQIATAESYIPPESSQNPDDLSGLRFSFLKSDSLGLLCLNNFQRHRKLTNKKNVEIAVDDVKFPPFDLNEGCSIIYPFLWDFNGIRIKYATAQPLCSIENETCISLFFWNYEKSMVFETEAGKVQIKQNEPYTVKIPGEKNIDFILLSREQAENAWKVNIKGRDALIITEAGIMNPGNELVFYGIKRESEAFLFQGRRPQASQWDNIPKIFEEIYLRPTKHNGNIDAECELVNRTDGNLVYRVSLPKPVKPQADDMCEVFLCVEFEGDNANLLHNGELIADCFYTGLEWRIGLNKFNRIEDGELLLEINPLYEDSTVYLEICPEYREGIACKLKSIRLDTVSEQRIL